MTTLITAAKETNSNPEYAGVSWIGSILKIITVPSNLPVDKSHLIPLLHWQQGKLRFITTFCYIILVNQHLWLPERLNNENLPQD